MNTLAATASPPFKTTSRADKTRCLDVGCGPAPDLPEAEVQVGLDIELASLRHNRKRYPDAHFVCGDGERLPFRDGAFDIVVSRVALPLMNLNAAIPEISRVLKPGGCVSLNLHHFGFALRDLLRRMRGGHPRAIIGGLWAIFNGYIFHFFGLTLRQPFSRRFYDSFQTYSGMSRILRQQGFSGSVVEGYVIKAQKAEESGLQ
ncbi:MAG: class I SAM-dependent methyltransferase [Candidatus Sulfotelmatobacter sp.]